MDLPPVRRKINTYGKGARKILVHDLFDLGSLPPHDLAQQPMSRVASHPTQETFSPHPAEEKTWKEIPVADGLLDSLPARQPSPSGHSTSSASSPVEQTKPSMFDIESSDEDLTVTYQGPLNKRRKVIPVQRSSRGTSSERNLSRAKPRKGDNIAGQRPNSRPPSSKEDGPSKPGKSCAGLKSAQRAALKSSFKSTKSQRPPPEKTLSRRAPPQEVRVSSGSSAQLSDASISSPRRSRQTTPKRRRRLSDDGAANAPSPSELQMTSLKLTPERTLPQSRLFDDMDMTDGDPVPFSPPKPRKRLVDRLDAPRAQSSDDLKHISKPTIGQQSASQPVSGRDSPNRLSRNASALEASAIGTSASEDVKTAPPVRVARTYAKQRSHLSDMLDTLEPNSQHSSQQSYSQAASFTSLASQMDLDLDDDEDDENTTFKQPKSIHELRRAGAISKIDNELATLLDEIEAATKSARIHGLMQLYGKLASVTFLSHFQDSSFFTRFTDCAHPAMDEISALLIVLVLQKMASAASVTSKVSIQMLEALYRVPVQLATTNKTMRKLAKERRQNLSKFLISELTDFEESLERDRDSDSDPIFASVYFLTTLESTLRALIKHREKFPTLPTALLEELLLAMFMNRENLVSDVRSADHATGLQLVLSTLEIASFDTVLVGRVERSSHFPAMSECLAAIMQWAGHARRPLEQACLRFVVSVSNNQPSICKAFAKGQLIDRVYAVIDDHFSRVAAAAAQGQPLEGDGLDAAVLALGCLLNFADCADDARQKMLDSNHSGHSLVDGMVDIFNSYFDLASEADTLEQTQVLIPLGYISMLLCTLCLNARAYEKIAQSTKGNGLEDLFSAVETFLVPLRQVEMDLAATGGAPSGSFDRFMAIFQTVRGKVA